MSRHQLVAMVSYGVGVMLKKWISPTSRIDNPTKQHSCACGIWVLAARYIHLPRGQFDQKKIINKIEP